MRLRCRAAAESAARAGDGHPRALWPQAISGAGPACRLLGPAPSLARAASVLRLYLPRLGGRDAELSLRAAASAAGPCRAAHGRASAARLLPPAGSCACGAAREAARTRGACRLPAFESAAEAGARGAFLGPPLTIPDAGAPRAPCARGNPWLPLPSSTRAAGRFGRLAASIFDPAHSSPPRRRALRRRSPPSTSPGRAPRPAALRAAPVFRRLLPLLSRPPALWGQGFVAPPP